MKLNQREMPIRQEKELEILKAKTADQAALIEYLAVMGDIEIPQDDESEDIEHEE